MTFKGLLLGSAAALAAVSGARAADAVVYEPEPVEYVKVCDAYGAGFFYIPGTETCLSINGYVYFQVGGTSDRDGGLAITDTPGYHGFGYGGYNVATRGRLNIDARSDTEWGTLRSYIRLQGTWGTNIDGNVAFNQAYLELGGLRMGYTESAWVDSMNAGVAVYGSHSDGGLYYAYQLRHQVNYTFSANGFAATLSLEHDEGPAATDWVPDVVGVLSYNAGWGGAWAKVAYDNDYLILPGRQGGWSAQLGMQYNIPNMNGSSLRLLGFYADTPNAYAVGSEWSVLASYNHVFTDTFSASVGFQYFNDTNYALAGSPDAWAAELSTVWTPVQNFEVRTESVYTKADGLSGSLSSFVRFTRYF
ncbi:hypothetical protein CSC94_06565 [Zhengella mangrovi]|uniref:Porin n=1 Tax=Zhengella mangrovi TaxID=1982044 RepID=A0A2G1QRY7_9HYPH|nr:porin [Zhengella mangrovi]PHP68306.1 hypothetical protein CSC94_06565 [Zhengella mangrovi]